MSRDVTVLVHGPVTPFTRRTLTDALRHARQDRRVVRVVLATWDDADTDPLGALLDEVEVLRAPDVANPGFANLNRQVRLVRLGLDAVPEDHVVVKLRTDQTVDHAALLRRLDERAARLEADVVFTTDCFTRTDRRYHPSDMLLVARRPALALYYDLPEVPTTHLDDVLAVREDLRRGAVADVRDLHLWPEARLFMAYLRRRGEAVSDTDEDSARCLARYCELLSASDVGLRWEKFYGGRLPLVPYRFSMAPFEGGPVEEARCVPTSGSPVRQAVKDRLGALLWGPRLARLRA
ncbi:WavE lipopolysaccharide synthesis family protein [Cellulomonas marina]|uniref:WavE lipopolysaccharide synthesis n=1 Tax=Cellulomonas marina TaxID=988821 RepID=A0A1I0UYY9_9CELL|nr:WavE lipopolysaccharide synthesis family protein [Cellulomonas marina]GIG29910.1 hypothetical protein Cma02nite_25100 [Cellulomonas marina]SFA69232.1 WavE lipopolysaccharide synthesis [Cellulomonas marina]